MDTLFELFDKTVESSDEMGVTFVAKIMIKAALQLASNPQIVGAVLSVIVVIGFVIYLAQHWTEIKALIKVIGDFTGRLSIVFSAWAENLAELTVNLIKIAGEKVIAVCQDIKQEILDFINRLRQEAYSFCIRILQELSFYFGSIEKWIKCLFGGCSGLLRGSNQILIIIDRIEELQHRIKTLHMTYFEAEKKLGDAKTLVQKVYNDYDESYVRRCCRDIQNDLKNAQKYLNSVEQELAQKRRVLVMAVSDYYQSDQNAVRVIRTFG